MPDEKKIVFVKKKKVSPGALYKEITTEAAMEETKAYLEKKKVHPFVSFCRQIYKMNPSMGKGAVFTDDYKEAIDFLGWDLKPEELNATVKFILMTGIALVALLAVLFFVISPIQQLLYNVLGSMAIVYLFVIPMMFVMVVVNYINKYPLNVAKLEEKKALTYVPEIVGYLVMSLKLVPNLEKAVEFAAEHGKGKIAEEFKQLLWNVQLGIYNTLAEGLDEMAYRWGNFSPEFKQALMRLRASVLEDSEAKRYALLDKTIDDVLASIREKMENYARSLNQPAVMLFYVGILLPLILIIVLPIGSAFTASPLAQPLVLAVIYNVLIPGGAFIFAMKTIKERPPTYIPPKISDDYPGLPKKWHFKLKHGSIDLRVIVVFILIAGLAFSYFISANGLPPEALVKGSSKEIRKLGDIDIEPILFPFQIIPKDSTAQEILEREGVCSGSECNTYYEEGGKRWNIICRELNNCQTESDIIKARVKLATERTQFFSKKETDPTPYAFVFGLLLTFGLIFYFVLKYRNYYKRQAQLEVISLESEFRDSLYVIASRMGENRPVEDALEHTRKFLPKYKISDRIYGKTLDNIRLLGMSLEQAIFDKKYGSLVNVPSTIIVGGMKILVDAVRLGVNVGARTLVSLSLQLENSDKVTKLLKTLLSDMTTMMTSMISLIAPLVLGITATLQKIVLLTLAGIVSSGVTTKIKMESTELGNLPISPSTVGELFKPEAFISIATPLQFLFIIAIYVIEITVILTYFTTKIEEDNDLLFKMNLARNLPIALLVFIISVVLSNAVVSSVGGI